MLCTLSLEPSERADAASPYNLPRKRIMQNRPPPFSPLRLRIATSIAGTAAALGLLAGIAPAGAQTPPQLPRIATLSVTGQGSVDRSPDRAYVTFGIVTDDDSAARATSANNAAYGALQAKLAALGLTGAAVRTTSYSVNYNARPPQPNPQYPQRYGYVVSRSVTVTSDRTDGVGAIIDAGIAAGTTTVGGVSFGLRDNRAAARAAIADAMADADGQAHALADAAHVRIVRIVTVSANGSSMPRPIPFARSAMLAAPVPTDVQPSDLTITGNVTVVYEVAP